MSTDDARDSGRSAFSAEPPGCGTGDACDADDGSGMSTLNHSSAMISSTVIRSSGFGTRIRSISDFAPSENHGGNRKEARVIFLNSASVLGSSKGRNPARNT